MEKYTCYACDINTTHSAGFVHSSENNTNCWLLMNFHTDFFYYADGEKKSGKSGQFILHPPGATIIHGPCSNNEKGFINDWIYFKGSDAEETIANAKLPINRSFYMEKNYGLKSYISNIMYEQTTKPPLYEEKISCIISDMLISAARSKKIERLSRNTAFPAISKAREIMLTQYGKHWTLEHIAQLSGYSASRFCALYKQFYNSSPIDDLINCRLENAAVMLLAGDISINKAAEICGFSSIHYFSRIFKEHYGVSPSAYKHSGR